MSDARTSDQDFVDRCMGWWESISAQQRQHWLSVAGNGLVADAYRAYLGSLQ